jgi:hypothetical protein
MNAGGIVVPEEEKEPSSTAYLEASAFARGDLRRYEAVRTHIHHAGLVVLWAVVLGGLILALIWAWHLATPESLHFLSMEQRNDIQMVLLSAVGSSFATQAGKRWIDPKSSEASANSN